MSKVDESLWDHQSFRWLLAVLGDRGEAEMNLAGAKLLDVAGMVRS